MANPQLENGYTRIANELLQALAFIHLPTNEWQVLLVIIRRTYGFKKKVDKIANFQICEATGLRKDVVSRALHKLEMCGIIFKNGKTIGFQKDYQQWKLAELQTKKLAELQTELAKLPTKVCSTMPEKDNIKKKENNQKKYINNDKTKELQEAWK